ncbi:hypothetical protein GW17_00002321 [Ensete ventricosum]|nr:hypothetical protein GW17_00002321 [Ensete ventricosum]
MHWWPFRCSATALMLMHMQSGERAARVAIVDEESDGERRGPLDICIYRLFVARQLRQCWRKCRAPKGPLGWLLWMRVAARTEGYSTSAIDKVVERCRSTTATQLDNCVDVDTDAKRPSLLYVPEETSSKEFIFSNVVDDRCSFSEVSGKLSYSYAKGCEEFDVQGSNNYVLFKEFCKSGLTRLGCMFSEDIDLPEIWKEAQPYTEFIGPFWALRAALGPLVESYILLDRLLFLQEQGNSVEAFLFPIFDPTLSPRNMAVIARRK